MQAQLEGERGAAEALLAASREEAERIRRDGEERLKQIVVDAQEAARRESEDRARDRTSRVRAATQRWVTEAERQALELVESALDVCCGDEPGRDETDAGGGEGAA